MEKAQKKGGQTMTPTVPATDWEAKYQSLRTVHEVFCEALRKAIGMECPCPISDILDTVIALAARHREQFKARNDVKSASAEKGHGTPTPVSQTQPNDKYYGAWREADDLVLFKLPGHEPFRISNKAAERLYYDFVKICGLESGGRNSLNLNAMCQEAAEHLFPYQLNPRIPLAATRQNAAEVIRQIVVGFTKPIIDFAEWGFAIIANAGGGNWEKESKDWQEAAAKYRDDFFNRIRNYDGLS
jgi:hypothetical protein